MLNWSKLPPQKIEVWKCTFTIKATYTGKIFSVCRVYPKIGRLYMTACLSITTCLVYSLWSVAVWPSKALITNIAWFISIKSDVSISFLDASCMEYFLSNISLDLGMLNSIQAFGIEPPSSITGWLIFDWICPKQNVRTRTRCKEAEVTHVLP